MQVCILGVCLIARPQLETDKHKAHLHLAGIIVGLFQAFFSGATADASHLLKPSALFTLWCMCSHAALKQMHRQPRSCYQL